MWWFLGHVHTSSADGLVDIPLGWRVSPRWISELSHPAIALMGLPASLAFWRLRRPRADALGLLALLLLVRCVVDPWNYSYYELPFLIALLAWEARSRGAAPVGTLLVTAIVWFTFQVAPRSLGVDAQCVTYLAWSLPLSGLLGLRVFAPARLARLLASAGRRLPTLAAGVASR
jgi:hypothetical protein